MIHGTVSDAADVPEDLRFCADFEPCSLVEQIRAARAEVIRYRTANLSRIQRDRGHFSMAPLSYAQEIHRRRSVLHTLVQLQKSQTQEAMKAPTDESSTKTPKARLADFSTRATR